jgi:hypothetical protein
MCAHSRRFSLRDKARHTTVNRTAALAQQPPGSHYSLWDRAPQGNHRPSCRRCRYAIASITRRLSHPQRKSQMEVRGCVAFARSDLTHLHILWRTKDSSAGTLRKSSPADGIKVD